ncbi:MAG: DUF4139 domain-containing protein [Polyangiaceae bacterium]|nr:DUF4139 domain-containing protein [Polyangiaceae bacterium]
MTPASLASRIDSVRLFRRGALVRRIAPIPTFEREVERVRIVDLPLCLDDTTVRLESLHPSVSLFDVSVALDAAERVAADGSSDERELESKVREDATLRAKLAAIEAAIGAVEAMVVHGRPPGPEGEPPKETDVDAPLSLLAFRRERSETLTNDKRTIEAQLARLTDERRILSERIARSRGSVLPKPDELRKSVVVTLRTRGTSSEPGSIALDYFVPVAQWAPAYVLRTNSRERRASLELRAVVAQGSGEDWRDVALSLSTAEIMRHHELPELTSLRIGRAQPSPKKRAWRPMPFDPAELFADFERELGPPVKPVSAVEAAAAPADEPVAALAEADAVTAIPPPMQALARPVPVGAAPGLPSFARAPVPHPASAPPGFGGMAMGGAMPMNAPMAAAPQSRAQLAEAEDSGVLRSKGGRDLKARLGKAMKRESAASFADELLADVGAADIELEIDRRFLSYELLRMPPPEQQRGKLRLASTDEQYLELSSTIDVRFAAQIRKVVELSMRRTTARTKPLPSRHVEPEPVGGFDYVHTCASRVDVPSDGAFHSIPITTIESTLQLRHVVVPTESADVFRFVEIDNPIDAPLLRGPCDVYFDREFLLTIDLATIAPRGRIRAGLGVDQSVKCARNTHFSESTSGLMGGSLALKHTIKIELVNHRPDTVDVEVQERVPFVPEREDDIKVEIAAVQPPWQKLEPPLGSPPIKGAHAWRVNVEPSAKMDLAVTYVVKLPSKFELAGGNRRD